MEWSFDEIRGFIPKSISLPYSREEKNGYRSVLTGRDELNYIMFSLYMSQGDQPVYSASPPPAILYSDTQTSVFFCAPQASPFNVLPLRPASIVKNFAMFPVFST